MPICCDRMGVPTRFFRYSPLMRRHWRQRNATGGLQPTVRTLSRDSPDDVIAAYPTARFGGNAAAAFKAADGDYNVVCPARVIADWIELSGRSAFLFCESSSLRPVLRGPLCPPPRTALRSANPRARAHATVHRRGTIRYPAETAPLRQLAGWRALIAGFASVLPFFLGGGI